jgi:hypothetical protein
MQPSPTFQGTSYTQAISIGKVARSALENVTRGSILGVTSRGIFLQLPTLRVLFLSREAFQGPLTINLPGETFPEAEVGELVEIHSGLIQFSKASVTISTNNSTMWSAPAVSKAIISPVQREIRLREVATGIILAKDGYGFSSLLGELLGISAPLASGSVYYHLLPVLRQAQAAIHRGHITDLVPLLASFFGLGTGLTPSGDDLIMGLFLCLNRYKARVGSQQALDEINQQAVKTAFEKTTSLSANLIECAVEGQADERLITAVDGIYCEFPSTTDCINALLAWGHSSGSDALLGITLATLAAADGN